jgi:hypothetical protein
MSDLIEVDERTDFDVTYTFRDGYGNLEAPTHVYFGIRDEASGVVIRAEAEVSGPASIMTIPVTAAEARILSEQSVFERRILTVRATYADGRQRTYERTAEITNLHGVTTPA